MFIATFYTSLLVQGSPIFYRTFFWYNALMSDDTFRVVLVVVIIGATIAFLAITADVMMRHPSLPWFGFGALAVFVVEAIGYLVYRLIKHISQGRVLRAT